MEHRRPLRLPAKYEGVFFGTFIGFGLAFGAITFMGIHELLTLQEYRNADAGAVSVAMPWITRLICSTVLIAGTFLSCLGIMVRTERMEYLKDRRGAILLLFSSLLALGIGLAVISFVWISSRPMMGILFLLPAALMLGGAVFIGTTRNMSVPWPEEKVSPDPKRDRVLQELTLKGLLYKAVFGTTPEWGLISEQEAKGKDSSKLIIGGLLVFYIVGYAMFPLLYYLTNIAGGVLYIEQVQQYQKCYMEETGNWAKELNPEGPCGSFIAALDPPGTIEMELYGNNPAIFYINGRKVTKAQWDGDNYFVEYGLLTEGEKRFYGDDGPGLNYLVDYLTTDP